MSNNNIDIRQCGENQGVVIQCYNKRLKVKEINENGDKKTHCIKAGTGWGLFTTFFSKKSVRIFVSVSLLFFISGAGIVKYQTRDTLENRLYKKYHKPKTEVFEMFFIASSALDEAKGQYEEGDYKAALLLFQNLPSNVNFETERQYYLALTLMELNQHEEAIQRFLSVRNNALRKDMRFMVEWNLALCYLKINDKANAINSFKKVANHNLYNSREAKRILKRLA